MSHTSRAIYLPLLAISRCICARLKRCFSFFFLTFYVSYLMCNLSAAGSDLEVHVRVAQVLSVFFFTFYVSYLSCYLSATACDFEVHIHVTSAD